MGEIGLINEYREMHEKGFFCGYSLNGHCGAIAELVDAYKPKNLLDYGCGKGMQYTEKNMHNNWGGIMPTLYDPAVPGIDKKPPFGFDGVICTDVAEHVPEGEVLEFLKDVFRYAKKFVFMTICTRPAKKTLPNGMNAHVTVKDEDWWLQRINEAQENKRVHIEVVFTK